MKSFLHAVRERVVIYDGAMGTQIQDRNPSLDDFWGKENCSEVLVLSRPDMIKDIHAAYFQAGADVVETNTFGATSIVLQALGAHFFGLAGAAAGLSVAYLLATCVVLVYFVQMSGLSARVLLPTPGDFAFYVGLTRRVLATR